MNSLPLSPLFISFILGDFTGKTTKRWQQETKVNINCSHYIRSFPSFIYSLPTQQDCVLPAVYAYVRPHAPTLSPGEWSPSPPLCGLKQTHPTPVRHPRRTRCASMHVNNLIACFRCSWSLIFGSLLIFLVQVKRKEGILISKRGWSTMRLSCKA